MWVHDHLTFCPIFDVGPLWVHMDVGSMGIANQFRCGFKHMWVQYAGSGGREFGKLCLTVEGSWLLNLPYREVL